MPPPKKNPIASDALQIDAKRRELEGLRSRLVDRSNDLDTQAVELVARRTELDKQAERLSQLQEQIEGQQRSVVEDRQRLRHELDGERERLTREIAAERQRLTRAAATERQRLKQQDAKHRQQVENDRQMLTDRLHRIEKQEQDLEHRIAKARDEIVSQRAEAHELRAGAQRRAGEVEAGLRALERERNEWDGKLKELLSKAGELDRLEIALDRRGEQFERERIALAEGGRKLDESRQTLKAELEQLEGHRRRINKGRENLEQRATQLDKQLDAERRKIAGEFDAERTQAARANKKLDARREKLKRDRDGLAERAGELKSFEKALEGREGSLAAARERLRDAEGELEQHRVSIDALKARAVEYEESLDGRRSDLDRITEQIEERDAQSRQSELALEVEEQEIARSRAALEMAEQRLDESRARRSEELEATHAILHARVEKIEQAERSVLITPPLWWLRASVAGLVVGLTAGWAWLMWEKPVYRARVELALRTTSHQPERALGQHAALLMSPGAVERWIDDAALGQVWRRSLGEGRVAVELAVEPPRIALALSGERPEAIERVVRAAAERYRDHVNGIAGQPRIAEVYADIPIRKKRVVEEIRKTRALRGEAETLLAVVPPAARRDELLGRVGELRERHTETVRLLGESRQKLISMESGSGVVRGAVDPQEYRRALAQDESYQADTIEFRSEASRYRKELAVGMVPMTERFSGMLAALREFTAALDDQLAARPAPAIAAALEACSGLAEDFEQNVQAVEQRWAAWRGSVATMEVGDDVADLFRQQAVADQAARRLVRDCADWLAAVEQRLDTLKEGEGGATRQMVIVTALRSGLARVDLAHKRAARAARDVGRSSNFRLDAHDTRLRGLQTRLSRRRNQVRSNLQNRADRRTVVRREAELAATGDKVEEYESLRGELVIELIDRMDALRGLDDDMLERSQLEAAVRRHGAELARLEEQDRYLAGQLDEARRFGPQPDRIIAVTNHGSEQTAGARRWSHAVAAGAVVFGTVWLFCLLMILRNPFRRNRSLAETLGIGESAGAELRVEAR